jgi:hypothetical protein
LTPCPTEAEILVFSLDDAAGTPGRVARHVADCPICGARVAEQRRVIAAIGAAADTARSGHGSCLDDAALSELAEGTEDAEHRFTSVAHLSTCGHCRQEFAAVVVLLTDPEIVTETRRLSPTPARKSKFVGPFAGLGVIAAAILMVIVMPRTSTFRESSHRASTITAAAVPALTAPVGDVGAATALRWAAVAGADRYRVTLFDATGHVLYETQIVDTEVALPDSVIVAPGRSYLWKVEARAGFERWTSSDLTEFRVSAKRSR